MSGALMVREVVLGVLEVDASVVSVHRISRNLEEALGIYPRRGNRARVGAVGGEGLRGFGSFAATMLLRWGRDGVRAEEKAFEIYQKLSELKFDGGFVVAVNDAPVWLGADSRGVFEYVFDFDFYFNK